MSHIFVRILQETCFQKNPTNTEKASKHNERIVFLRVSTGGVNFVFYTLSTIHPPPHYLHQFTFLPPTTSPPEFPPPPDRAGIRDITTASPLTPDKAPSDHRAPGDASVVTPVAASDEDLPTPRLRIFVATVDYDRKLWPIQCSLS